MARRGGLQTEVLLSLALVMLLATVLLSAVWVASHEASLRRVVGRALLAEARAARPRSDALFPGTDWWVVGPAGAAQPRGGVSAPLDRDTRRLAEEATAAGAPLLRPGPVWAPIRFAAPLGGGQVALARLPQPVSVRLRLVPVAVGGAVLLADALIFTAFGAVLLRRRVVAPLQRLAAAARALGAGAPGLRVAEEETREAADVARAFNEMSEALEGRTEALRKAVAELRGANEDLRRTRAGLDRAERLAAVGRLAAGVAHEVGNPIGALLALLDLAGRDPGVSEATRRHLARAGQEGERVRVILRQLLDFSRPPRAVPAPVDLAAVARETVALLGAQRRYGAVAFAVRCEAGAPLAHADPAAVSQILLNLLLNAADAVAGAAEARVELVVRPALGRRRAGDGDAVVPARRRADAAEILVADTGCGIAEGDRERIFDPFFTTRPPGEGTGLGLANASRLAEELGGGLELVEAPPGFRTAFLLLLPAAPAADAAVRGAG